MTEIIEFLEEFGDLPIKNLGRRGPEDLTGRRFGRLVALRIERKAKKRTYWEFLCDCGNHKVIAANHAKFGDLKSCGCSRRWVSWRTKFENLLKRAIPEDREWAMQHLRRAKISPLHSRQRGN